MQLEPWATPVAGCIPTTRLRLRPASGSTRWSRGERDVLLALLTYQPTTLAGIVAVLEHVSRQDWVYGDDSDQTILVDAHEREIEETQAFPKHLATALRNIIARGQA
jgi:hypothetical protein